MSTTTKLAAGGTFPDITLPKLRGGTLRLTQPENGHDWRMVVVYRGKHCPICTRYLRELNTHLPALNAIGIDLVAISGDPEEKALDQMDLAHPDYDIGYGLTLDQMRALGLYISHPRSPQETDRPFAEPAVFVINADGNLQVTEIANGPFVRPDLELLVGGLKFIRNPDNDYPVRGTHV
ncbi:peroxiredoxin-like family protein [Nitratireductor kimnyeongensis]|uniref:Peroxiredoxin-like family protein n=1 Tax=Nitratireductor kimnyeongensis TaxID=430679 RepID=A0ABW0T9N9_9HYPH|nr:peroxiredoxin-like family protein [Nitratireductor kimnyeongensis]QZZ35478.1 AhpC/TSA family protein [Nitratireductor kimnyeongensis]